MMVSFADLSLIMQAYFVVSGILILLVVATFVLVLSKYRLFRAKHGAMFSYYFPDNPSLPALFFKGRYRGKRTDLQDYLRSADLAGLDSGFVKSVKSLKVISLVLKVYIIGYVFLTVGLLLF